MEVDRLHADKASIGINFTRQALEWNLQGKRKIGRPRKTWGHDLEENKRIGFS